MNYLRIFILIPVVTFQSFICGVYAISFLFLLPLKFWFPNFYFSLDSFAVKSLINIISASFKIGHCEVFEFGEDISDLDRENCLLLANHQSTVDVPLLMHIINFRQYLIFKTVWMLDAMFKFAPFGWVSLIRNDIFIQQGKETRYQEIAKLPQKIIRSFTRLNRKWLIIFPEGGFYYKRIESSKTYAEKNGYPILNFVTLPRMGAIEAALQVSFNSGGSIDSEKQMQSFNNALQTEVTSKYKIKYIIDLTIAYHNIQNSPSYFDMIMGSVSSHPVYVYYRIYDVDKIPASSSYELQKWMYQIYKEKNDRLAQYYSTGKFDHLESDKDEIPKERLMPSYKNVYISWESILFSLLIILLWTYLWLYYIPHTIIKTVCSTLPCNALQ